MSGAEDMFPQEDLPKTLERTVDFYEIVLGKPLEEFTDIQKKQLLQTGDVVSGVDNAA